MAAGRGERAGGGCLFSRASDSFRPRHRDGVYGVAASAVVDLGQGRGIEGERETESMRTFLRLTCFLWVSVLLTFSPLAGQEKKPAEKTDMEAPKGDTVAGKKLYKAHCAICHFADASIDKVGPGMKGLFQMKKLPKNGQPVTEENIRKIKIGRAHV